MPDPNDDLTQQMVQAGLYPEQIAQLQRRFALGQSFMQPQEAQGRQVGGTYVAASPLEHLSNAIRQIVGAKMTGNAMQKQQDLTGQLASGRQAFVGALQDSSGHPGEMMPGGMGDQQRMQQLSMMGSASGDPAMQHASEMYMQQQNQQRQMALLENTIRHQETLEALGAGRLGVSQQNAQNARQRTAQSAVKYNPNDGGFQNTAPLARPSVLPLSTGAAPAAPPGQPPAGGGGAPPPPPGAGSAPLGKWQDKALKELGADFNPSSGRSGEFGKNQARVNAANRILALAVDQNGNPRDLNPQQMPELAQSVASLIAAGGQGAQAQIEHLTPHSISGDYAKIAQWLSNEPHGSGQQAFVQNMVDTAKRESAVAQQGIDQVRGQLGMKHQRILQWDHGNAARKELNGFGWDLGPDGIPVMQQAQAPQSQAGGTTVGVVRKFTRVNGKLVEVK